MDKLLCNQKCQQRIVSNLKSFSRVCLEKKSYRPAAVCLTVVDFRDKGNLSGLQHSCAFNGAALILTRRAGNLNKHAGQWALPGGSIDQGENPAETALRELEEEVGLSLTKKSVLGYLDDYVTRSGFHITPVVLWGGEVEELNRNGEEVASIHRIPCSELFRPEVPILERGVEKGRPVLCVPVGTTYIASPTAAIMYQFKEAALSGRDTRVDHFDQPYFAWS